MLPPDVRCYVRKRYFVIALLFFAYMILFILRVNLSVCLVDMTSSKTITLGNETRIQEAEYSWTSSQIGIILSSFAWGFSTAPLTVIVIDKFGSASMFASGLFVTGILTVISPIMIQQGISVYIAGRFLEGVSEGVAISASYGVFADWIPQHERSRSINFVVLGVPLGTAVGYPLSGYISYTTNWRYVFYITGGLAIGWSVLWISFVRGSPTSDVFISKKEKLYLRAMNEPASAPNKNVLHKWKLLLTSKEIWAFLNELFVESWSFSFLTYCLPLFIKDMHNVSIDKIGIIAALPQICDLVSRTLGAWYQDHLRAKGTMSKTKIHKLFIVFGQISAIILFILIGVWNDFYGSLIILCLFKVFYTLADVSYWVLPVDMTAQHSADVMALELLSLSIGYILNPIVMNLIVTTHSQSEWGHYFWFLCIFNVWGLIIFSRYGSGELLPWIRNEETSNKKEVSESS